MNFNVMNQNLIVYLINLDDAFELVVAGSLCCQLFSDDNDIATRLSANVT